MTQTPEPQYPGRPEQPTVYYGSATPSQPTNSGQPTNAGQPASPYTAPTAPYPAATASYPATNTPYAAPNAPYAGSGTAASTPGAPTPSYYGQGTSSPSPYSAASAPETAPATTPFAVPPVPPVSSQPAYGQPYAEQPLSSPPFGMPPAPAAAKPRRTSTIVLAAVTAVLFVVAGLLGGLLVAQRGETNRANTEIAAHKADLAAKAKKIEDLQTNLDSVNSENLIKSQELEGSKNDRDEQERQKKVVAKCLDLLMEAFAAQTESQFNKRIDAAEKTCDEADRYM